MRKRRRGLFATCIQHEIDHLNGVLLVDYLSKLKRDRVLKKFTEGREAGGLVRFRGVGRGRHARTCAGIHVFAAPPNVRRG